MKKMNQTCSMTTNERDKLGSIVNKAKAKRSRLGQMKDQQPTSLPMTSGINFEKIEYVMNEGNNIGRC